MGAPPWVAARGLSEDTSLLMRSALGRRANSLARREALFREAGAAQRRLGRLLLKSDLAALRKPLSLQAVKERSRLALLLAVKIRDLYAEVERMDRSANAVRGLLRP